MKITCRVVIVCAEGEEGEAVWGEAPGEFVCGAGSLAVQNVEK